MRAEELISAVHRLVLPRSCRVWNRPHIECCGGIGLAQINEMARTYVERYENSCRMEKDPAIERIRATKGRSALYDEVMEKEVLDLPSYEEAVTTAGASLDLTVTDDKEILLDNTQVVTNFRQDNQVTT